MVQYLLLQAVEPSVLDRDRTRREGKTNENTAKPGCGGSIEGKGSPQENKLTRWT